MEIQSLEGHLDYYLKMLGNIIFPAAMIINDRYINNDQFSGHLKKVTFSGLDYLSSLFDCHTNVRFASYYLIAKIQSNYCYKTS